MRILSFSDTHQVSGCKTILTYESLSNNIQILDFTMTNENDRFVWNHLFFTNDRFLYQNNSYLSSTDHYSSCFDFHVEMNPLANGGIHYYVVTSSY